MSAVIASLRRTKLYSKRSARVTLAALGVAAIFFSTSSLAAQARKRQPHAGPRSIAVLEWPAGTKPEEMDKVTPALIPAIVYQDLRYFDATIYMAKPVPLALDRGVFYEAQKSGVFAGEFLIDRARGGNADDPDASWYGLGVWNSAARIAAREAERKKRRSAADKRNDEFKKQMADDQRPVLRHSDGTASSSPTSQAGKTTASGSAGGDPAGPGRARAEAPPSSAVADNDPNRPLLRRGKPTTGEQVTSEKFSSVAPTATALARRPAMVAISDAKNDDAVSFDYEGSAEDRKRLEQEAMKLLQAELGGEAAKKTSGRSGKRKDADVALNDVKVRILDLFGANQSTVVISATVPGAAEHYVILVAAEDATATMQKLMFENTDVSRLDVQGRLLLVDAVDATGEGYGDLLFRRIGERSESFELYRSYGSQLLKLF